MKRKDTRMDNIQIEKNVPLPVAGPGAKFPLAEMEVGDSFFLPDRMPNQCSSIYRAAKRVGIVIATRGSEEGVRVWRTE